MKKYRHYNDICASNILDYISGDQFISVRKRDRNGEFTEIIFSGRVIDLIKQENYGTRNQMVNSRIASFSTVEERILVIGIEK